MLSIKNVIVHYGGVQALKGITLEAREGSITSLIGANGAGKSTTLRAVSGLIPITSGEIRFNGKRIDGLETERIVELGIVHVPEGKRLFLEMSVKDNLLSGAYLRTGDKDLMAKDLDRIYSYFPALKEARHRPASNLSGGEQQMVAIGRGLMANPKLMLLDEPSLGLSPILTKEVGSIIKRIASEGVTILLIEQNASLALSLSSKSYVMETGTIAVEGNSAELQNNDHVRAAYLGITANEMKPERKSKVPSSVKNVQQRAHDHGIQETILPGKNSVSPGLTSSESLARWDMDIGHDQTRPTAHENSVRWSVQKDAENPGTTDQGLLQHKSRVKESVFNEPSQGSSPRWAEPYAFSFDKETQRRWQNEKNPRPRVIKKSYVPKIQGK